MKKVFLLLSVLFILGCGSGAKKEEEKKGTANADQIAENFLQNLTSSNYKEFSKDFTKDLLEKYPEKTYLEFSKEVKEKLGKLNAALIDHKHAGTSSFENAYSLDFENDKSALIHIAFIVEDGKNIKINAFHLESKIFSKPGEKEGHPIQLPKEADALLLNILTAYNKGDYASYVKDFTENFKDKITEDVFKLYRQEWLELIGEFKTYKALRSFEKSKDVYVIYQAEFTKEEIVQIEMVLELFAKKSKNEEKKDQPSQLAPKVKRFNLQSPKIKQNNKFIGDSLKAIATNLQQNFDIKKYTDFSKDFQQDFKNTYNQQKFQNEYRQVSSKLGKWNSVKNSKRRKTPEGYDVTYKCEFEKDSNATLRIKTVIKDNKFLISEMTFNSDLLTTKK